MKYDLKFIGCAGVNTWYVPYPGQPYPFRELRRYKIVYCNYSHGNPEDGDYVYEGGETASKCKAINPQYPGLCAENEEFWNSVESYGVADGENLINYNY